jgi:hypothetical protein
MGAALKGGGTDTQALFASCSLSILEGWRTGVEASSGSPQGFVEWSLTERLSKVWTGGCSESKSVFTSSCTHVWRVNITLWNWGWATARRRRRVYLLSCVFPRVCTALSSIKHCISGGVAFRRLPRTGIRRCLHFRRSPWCVIRRSYSQRFW